MNHVVELDEAREPRHSRIMVGIPTTGVITYDWHAAQMNLITPANWQAHQLTQMVRSPIGYVVAEARNLIVDALLRSSCEWLFFIDHDVLLPPNAYCWVDEVLRDPPSPVVGGLYYLKAYPSAPLIYRGRGTGSYANWTLGDKVWCDGLGMGCTLMHRSILEHVAGRSPRVQLGGQEVAQVFRTPREVWQDPETGAWGKRTGTEDLYFLSRVIDEGALRDSKRWGKLARQRYPFLVDTGMFCWHIGMDRTRYPLGIDLPPGYQEWRKAQGSTRFQCAG